MYLLYFSLHIIRIKGRKVTVMNLSSSTIISLLWTVRYSKMTDDIFVVVSGDLLVRVLQTCLAVFCFHSLVSYIFAT